MNKHGASLQTWTYGILFILLFLVILTSQILTPMNSTYNKSFSVGLNTSAIDEFETARQSADSQIATGEVEQTNEGLTLKSAWSVGKLAYNTIVSFVTGEFIDNLLTNILGLPEEVGLVMRIIFLMSLIFVIIYLFMKVKP